MPGWRGSAAVFAHQQLISPCQVGAHECEESKVKDTAPETCLGVARRVSLQAGAKLWWQQHVQSFGGNSRPAIADLFTGGSVRNSHQEVQDATNIEHHASHGSHDRVLQKRTNTSQKQLTAGANAVMASDHTRKPAVSSNARKLGSTAQHTIIFFAGT